MSSNDIIADVPAEGPGLEIAYESRGGGWYVAVDRAAVGDAPHSPASGPLHEWTITTEVDDTLTAAQALSLADALIEAADALREVEA